MCVCFVFVWARVYVSMFLSECFCVCFSILYCPQCVFACFLCVPDYVYGSVWGLCVRPFFCVCIGVVYAIVGVLCCG